MTSIEQRAADLYGLRPSAAVPCPRVVARRRCNAARYQREGDGRLCVCQRHPRLLTHARLWLDEAGRRILTAEPHHATGGQITALVADVAELGLRVTLGGRSLRDAPDAMLIRISAPASRA